MCNLHLEVQLYLYRKAWPNGDVHLLSIYHQYSGTTIAKIITCKSHQITPLPPPSPISQHLCNFHHHHHQYHHRANPTTITTITTTTITNIPPLRHHHKMFCYAAAGSVDYAGPATLPGGNRVWWAVGKP